MFARRTRGTDSCAHAPMLRPIRYGIWVHRPDGRGGSASARTISAVIDYKGTGMDRMVNDGGKMTLRQWLPLVGLACSAFVFNTSEFMPIGLLTDIGSTFGLTEAGTGVMITAYAWAVMLLSLPLMVIASRVEFKRLLLFVIALFASGQFLSAAAPTYLVLVLARLVVACAHAVFWSVVAVIATRLVDVEHGPLAISMVSTGTAVAQIFGLPLGRAIGLLVGWRLTFACVGTVALVLVAYVAAVFPALAAGEPFDPRRVPLLFRNRPLVGIYAVTVLYATAYYTGYSYIEPFLAQVAGLPAGDITFALMVFGVAGLLASLICTRWYDGHRLGFIGFSVVGVAAALLLMRPFAGVTLVAMLAPFVIWGACNTIFSVGFQAELIRCTREDDAAVAMSIFSGIFNLGIGGGTALGGAAVGALGIGSIGVVGGAIGAAAMVTCELFLLRPLRSRRMRENG